jgi:hypothetical protein
MKLTKCLIILSLCSLLGSCRSNTNDEVLEIDIGDYEEHLAAWHRYNLLDYRLKVECWEYGSHELAYINVKNGIPESSDPPSWITKGKKSTIPEFYVYIKEEEQRIRDAFNAYSGLYDTLTCYFRVRYEHKLYPCMIDSGIRRRNRSTGPDHAWNITLMPYREQVTDNGEE